MPAPDPFTAPDARREWLRDQLRRKRMAANGEQIASRPSRIRRQVFARTLAMAHRILRLRTRRVSALNIERRTRMDYRHRVDAKSAAAPDDRRGQRRPAHGRNGPQAMNGSSPALHLATASHA